MNGREKLGTCEFDLLLANGKHEADVMTVELSTSTTVTKGDVLGYDSTSKKFFIVGTQDSESNTMSLEARAVAAETKTGTKVIAYRSGDFITGALGTANDYALTQADINSLQDAGIYLDSAME